LPELRQARALPGIGEGEWLCASIRCRISPPCYSRKSVIAVTNSRSATYEFNKLQKRLRREVGNAVTDFDMITNGDKIMV